MSDLISQRCHPCAMLFIVPCLVFSGVNDYSYPSSNHPHVPSLQKATCLQTNIWLLDSSAICSTTQKEFSDFSTPHSPEHSMANQTTRMKTEMSSLLINPPCSLDHFSLPETWPGKLSTEISVQAISIPGR